MAKGDKKKVQGAVNTGVNTSRNAVNDVTQGMIVPTTQNMYNNYNTSAGQAMGDYNDIMSQLKNYQSTAQGPVSAQQVDYTRTPEMNEAFGGYRNFMNTGGFSDADIANMRARGISPIRAVYSNMTNELARQKNLQGGYSPNMAAAMTRMRGSTSQQIADQVQNVNAALAEQIQRGKMFGTEGMGGLSTRDTEFAQQAKLANQNAALQAAGINASHPNDKLQSIMAQAQLYGTTPGMANMFGNQVLGSTRNWLDATGQQADIGRMGIQGQQAVSATPSNFETGLGRVGQIANIGSSLISPFMMGGGTGMLPSSRLPQARNINSGLYGAPGIR